MQSQREAFVNLEEPAHCPPSLKIVFIFDFDGEIRGLGCEHISTLVC
jgi:hypothetical protein